MSQYIAAYDIGRDSSRRAVARVLLRYGRRLQWSVFEVELEGDDLTQLKREVGVWLAKEDRFDVFPLDLRRPEGRLRWQRAPYADPVQLC